MREFVFQFASRKVYASWKVKFMMLLLYCFVDLLMGDKYWLGLELVLFSGLDLLACLQMRLEAVSQLRVSHITTIIRQLMAPIEHSSDSEAPYLITCLSTLLCVCLCRLADAFSEYVTYPSAMTDKEVDLLKECLSDNVVSTGLLNSLLNRLNWSFSELVGIMQEVGSPSGAVC